MESSEILVSVHVSSLSTSSKVTTIPLQTSRRNTPLPPLPTDADPPLEHAISSSILSTATSGTVLLRVIHNGLIIELSSVSSDVPPVRFVFPSPVLSAPAILSWEERELHVLAVTASGSLYRLVLPNNSGGQLWHDQVSRSWCREYLIQNVASQVEGVIQVQGTHCVAIGLSNGALLRLETELLGDDNTDDLWTETVFQSTSLFGSLTSFIPVLHAGPSGGSKIISIASHPQPTDVGSIWTVSRDRTLRLWTAKGGCIAAKSLASSGKALTSGPSSSNAHVLLDAAPQTLLKVFSVLSNRDTIYVLVFIPTPSSQSGGRFRLFHSSFDQLREAQSFESSPGSAQYHLQDFTIIGDRLYVLWDTQGTSTVEWRTLGLLDNQATHDFSWHLVPYASEAELSPTYLEELLLSPGSMIDKFLQAVLRPGVFSSLTLRAAIDQYTDACLSIPGSPPSQLKISYPSLAETISAVVGCTVNLMRDPHTGALQHDQYWNALKRDWEGFIARCREIERSARWPLMLGEGEKRNVVVVERERIGILAKEDVPLRTHRILLSSIPVGSPFSLMDILWTLQDKIDHRTFLSLENRFIDIIHQEFAFSFADIIQDQTRRSNFRAEMDEGLESWIIGRLQSLDNIEGETRMILDLVGGFDLDVKREEDEVELPLPSSHSTWTTALTAAYIASTIHARYDMCLALVTLLFFLAEDIKLWDPSLVEEVFAVFKGLAILRSVVHQPAGTTSVTKPSLDISGIPDDVVTRMNSMHVSDGALRFSTPVSLLCRLLSQSAEIKELPRAAHRFLDDTGLLQSLSPAHVTRFEVVFCERLRLLGFYQLAAEMVTWFPRTPAMVYVTSRLWIDLGRTNDAALLLQKQAGCFGLHSGLTTQDRDGLTAVLPGGIPFDSEFTFYLHAASLFKTRLCTEHEIRFSQLALSIAPASSDTSDIWYSLIKGYTDLGMYDDAYTALMTVPYEKIKLSCVGQLVYKMCEDCAVEQLLSFSFVGLSTEVENSLSFKARNVDPRLRPPYSKILYAWHTWRGDHSNASRTMYLRARKLQDFINEPTDPVSLANEQLESYVLAMNSLSLLHPKNAWIVVPVSDDRGFGTSKRWKLTNNIPGAAYGVEKHDSEIIDLLSMRYEYVLLSARLHLIRQDPTLLSASESLLSPSWVVLRLCQANQFDRAMFAARSLDVDMGEVFTTLTAQCLRLSRNPEIVLQEDNSDWLLTDRVSSWPGTSVERGWRYLRVSLERYDSAETDHRYSKMVLETVLSLDRSTAPPPWLIQSLQEYHHEYLIKISLRYEILESALEHTLSLLCKNNLKLARDPPINASSTWLPYTLIDQVLVAAASHDDLSAKGQSLRRELQAEISRHVKRMRKFNHLSV